MRKNHSKIVCIKLVHLSYLFMYLFLVSDKMLYHTSKIITYMFDHFLAFVYNIVRFSLL